MFRGFFMRLCGFLRHDFLLWNRSISDKDTEATTLTKEMFLTQLYGGMDDAPKLLERPTLIEITGSTAIDPTIPEGPQKHLTEATLTIRMDAKAAIQLSEQIWDLVRTSGLQ